MITGSVDPDGAPVVFLELAGRTWRAIIDTGFNGDLELPLALQAHLNPVFFARGRSDLAGGQSVEEDYYVIDFPFDGRNLSALASFVTGDEILIGTRLLQEHHLHVKFPEREVTLERVVR